MAGKKILLEKASLISDWIISIRRALHRNPELSYQEKKTASFISEKLREIGLSVEVGIGGEGVVGLLEGNNPGPTVALRADMDALPVDEKNDIEYRSVIPNCMHACGHDGHMAILLGAAKLLSQMREDLHGNIKFIFQPAEEVPPTGGAKGMISAGVLKSPDVDAIFGLHIWPELPTGIIGLREGPIMAAADRFLLKIIGQGGHGAAPHKSQDVVVASAQVVLSLQTLISRRINPSTPAVLSICKINGGSAYNILPDEVIIEGTTRYFDFDTGNILKGVIEEITSGICQSVGCSYLFDYQFGFPPTINNDDMTRLVEQSAASVLGENNVLRVKEPSMTGEDFSYFLQQVPGCYFWLGTNNPDKGITQPLHSSNYQLDEDILAKGSAIFSSIVLSFLNLK